jgi:quinol monooxygenase YgiN
MEVKPPMSHPIVFISNQRIKPGKLDEYKQYYLKVAAFTEANKPGTVAHLGYINEAGTEATIVHVFSDAEAMEQHMRGVGKIAEKAGEFMELVSWELYGRPSRAVLEGMLKIAGPSVTLTIKPDPIGGYLRLAPG